jgi:predicted porin
MQKKLLAVAVAGALVAPAAFAQTSVTISGALNLWWESAAATGATAGSAFDAKSRDRLIDGAGSNIRFTVVEDLGGGMQAFGQVESAVFNNADTRNNAVGAGAVTGGWANRNSGIGLRSNAWGEILMGIWDVHYQEIYAVDSHILKGTSNSNTLGIFNQFGTSLSGGPITIGARYSNVIRYQSPSWSGFNVRAAYVRPTDGIPPNTPGVITDNAKNRAYNIVPNYSSGPLYLAWSYLKDKDITSVASGGAAAAGGPGAVIPAGALLDIVSNRFFAAYTFPMGFKVGFVYDQSKATGRTAAGSGDLKRDAWAIPLSYTTGPHAIFFNYAKAKSWKGSAVDGATATIGGTTYSFTGDTGARMISLGYQYELSKRTNVHLTYAQIRNDALAGYDFFSAPVGAATTTATGADPRVYSIGLRHAF